MNVYQKGNFWKVSGSSKKYATKEEAEFAAGIISEPVVEETFDDIEESEEEVALPPFFSAFSRPEVDEDEE
ncbi:MAG: hypothetical protein VW577_04050 [Pelagibacteraceae bacterium]